MALSSYWVSQKRKDLAERAIVAKREKDATRAQKCLEVDSYHKELAMKSSKYKSLEESQGLKTPRANEESSVKEEQKASQKQKLQLRRQRLACVLAVENEQYMRELEQIRDSNRETDPWNIRQLKEQIEELQRKRKENVLSMHKRYVRHIFNSVFDNVKENDAEEFLKQSSESWEERKKELEQYSKEKKQMICEKLKSLELEQLQAVREAREVEIVQLEEQEKWSNIVQKKVNELNKADGQTKKLKTEKELLIQHLETLLSLQSRRQTVRDLQKKALQKMQVMWRPKEKLRRVLVEVQHALDFDYKLLLTMENFNSSLTDDTASAVLDLDCVVEVRNKIEMQIALEKKREVEIQQLYNEEAERVVSQRLEQWSLESIARDDVMGELFKTLAKEINKKIESNIEQEKGLIHKKEIYLKEIDEANQEAKETIKTLEEKQQYFLDRAKRLGEELEAYQAAHFSKKSKSSGKSTVTSS